LSIKKQNIIIFFSLFFTFAINTTLIASEIVKNDLLIIFKRTMLKWNINYDNLKENKAGAVCVPKNIDKIFIEKGWFSAIGYSYNMASKEYAIKTALTGCEQMYKKNNLDKKCKCIPIIYNNISNLD
tara:strand:- start:122 stop:502 length:381 start_codon:yes stop_codon:yes gene_type:complete